jgi:hypothetical protein
MRTVDLQAEQLIALPMRLETTRACGPSGGYNGGGNDHKSGGNTNHSYNTNQENNARQSNTNIASGNSVSVANSGLNLAAFGGKNYTGDATAVSKPTLIQGNILGQSNHA